MENSDNLAGKFKSSFSDFEQEPPARIWENLRNELHPGPEPETFWMRISGSSLFPQRLMRRYIALATASVLLFLAVVYFASDDQHAIRGHAYAGETRLCGGTAILFRITDKTEPWDSVNHYRSALIDENGYYTFSGVAWGNYLLRIMPEEHSEESKNFLPSWFDQHDRPDSSHVIAISTDDINADVHLMTKNPVMR
jgi:hypothetical protein